MYRGAEEMPLKSRESIDGRLIGTQEGLSASRRRVHSKVGRYTGILLVDNKFQKSFSYCGCYSLYRYIKYRGSGYSRYAIINFRY